MKEEFGTLRRETIVQIFRAALKKSGNTRADIAASTGLSVMTVGKVADALISLGILSQINSSDSALGRPSRILNPSRRLWIAVYELCDTAFHFYMLDLSLRIIDSFEYTPGGNVFIDDDVRVFTNLAGVFAASRRKRADCIGCGILVPRSNTADSEEVITDAVLSGIHINSAFSACCFGRKTLQGCSRTYMLERIKETLSPETFAAVFFMDRTNVECTVIAKSKDGAMSSRPCLLNDLNKLSCSGGDVEAFCKSIAELIVTSSYTLGIDSAVLCGNMLETFESISDVIGDMVHAKCSGMGIIPPEIIYPSSSGEAAIGISLEIRDKWFFEEMLNSY